MKAKPCLIKSVSQLEKYPPFPFPLVGPYPLDGWVLDDSFLADSTQCGRSSEPALTPQQLKGRLKIGKAYGVIDSGKFQVLVGEFSKKSPTTR